jgi:hypothetical protein
MRDFALAKGVMVEREGVDEDAASTALLSLVLDNGTPPRRLVEEVTLSTRQPPLRAESGFDD